LGQNGKQNGMVSPLNMQVNLLEMCNIGCDTLPVLPQVLSYAVGRHDARKGAW